MNIGRRDNPYVHVVRKRAYRVSDKVKEDRDRTRQEAARRRQEEDEEPVHGNTKKPVTLAPVPWLNRRESQNKPLVALGDSVQPNLTID